MSIAWHLITRNNMPLVKKESGFRRYLQANGIHFPVANLEACMTTQEKNDAELAAALAFWAEKVSDLLGE